MGSIGTTPDREVASIFNSAIASWAIGTAWEVGILDKLRESRRLHATSYAKKNDLDIASTEGLVTSLVVVDILKRDGDEIVPGRLFEETYRTKSLFHWLSLGSGALFSRMQYVVRNENRHGDYYTRDSAAIAYACRDINTQHFEPAFFKALDGVSYDVHRVVDLGCGSGGRLMQILDRFPQATGIGIDLAGPALKVASSEAVQRGYGNRLSLTEGDARALQYRDEFSQVDLLTCFMMGHDFWPRENCIATLQNLREIFPNVRRFILGDATRILLGKEGKERDMREADVPVFTLGFELGHAMMGVYLPTLEQWDEVFADGGWRCVNKNIFYTPSKSVVFELERL
ncbi:methyltransferase mppj [Fusarium flagelliforme]|uniref:Methyltransferase mppj n=1 Tax=Fusarium flagelliforme TaxID=2675880 RepID=A0A395MZ23_9HYPO|nr:methyltransferase mppj [Fusarium flagelliforme]